MGPEAADPSIIMLDQLWRVIAAGLMHGLLYAIGAAPIVYVVSRLVQSDHPKRRHRR